MRERLQHRRGIRPGDWAPTGCGDSRCPRVIGRPGWGVTVGAHSVREWPWQTLNRHLPAGTGSYQKNNAPACR